jgi:hypothetical protein
VDNDADSVEKGAPVWTRAVGWARVRSTGRTAAWTTGTVPIGVRPEGLGSSTGRPASVPESAAVRPPPPAGREHPIRAAASAGVHAIHRMMVMMTF